MWSVRGYLQHLLVAFNLISWQVGKITYQSWPSHTFLGQALNCLCTMVDTMSASIFRLILYIYMDCSHLFLVVVNFVTHRLFGSKQCECVGLCIKRCSITDRNALFPNERSNTNCLLHAGRCI